VLRYSIIFDPAVGLLTVAILVWGRKTAPLFVILALAVNLYTGQSWLPALLLACADVALSGVTANFIWPPRVNIVWPRFQGQVKSRR